MSLKINSFFGKIYYINLEEDIAKKNYFLSAIKDSCVQQRVERFNAIIGKYLDIRILKDNIISEKAKQDILAGKQHTYGISLTYGSLACALSHYQIYEECSKQSKPYLIFEDDVVLLDNFDTNLNILIEELENNVENYDLFYLGYNQIPGFTKEPFSNLISIPQGLITGLYGYILTPNGASKLLSTIFPLDKQIDSSISDNREKFDLYCAETPIVDVKINFGSKTQQDNSCKNIFNEINKVLPQNNRNEDKWLRLFQ